MEENQNLENEEMVKEVEKKEETGITIQGFGQVAKKSNTKCDIFTNITDNKKIFNLENHVDNLLNDFENSIIEVKDVLIKKYTKMLKEPVIDEQTGEILKNKEYSMSCVLVDKNGVSYATGSKVFTIQMQRYLDMFGIDENGFLIKITKNKTENGKTLGFELV